MPSSHTARVTYSECIDGGLNHWKKKRENPVESLLHFSHCVKTLSLIQTSKQSFVVGIMICFLGWGNLVWRELLKVHPGRICLESPCPFHSALWHGKVASLWSLFWPFTVTRKVSNSLLTPFLSCCLFAHSFIRSGCVTLRKKFTLLSPILFHWKQSYW